MKTDNISKYGYIRVGAVTPSIRVADINYNVNEIISAIDSAKKNKCSFLLFPELSITGYTCADLFFQKTLLSSAKKGIDRIVLHTGLKKSSVIIGAPLETSGKLFNCAVVISCGQIKGIVPKTFLCNTKEYYEERWFSSEADRLDNSIIWNGESIPFGADLIFDVSNHQGCTFGIEICEDLWTLIPPSISMAAAGANILMNLVFSGR